VRSNRVPLNTFKNNTLKSNRRSFSFENLKRHICNIMRNTFEYLAIIVKNNILLILKRVDFFFTF